MGDLGDQSQSLNLIHFTELLVPEERKEMNLTKYDDTRATPSSAPFLFTNEVMKEY